MRCRNEEVGRRQRAVGAPCAGQVGSPGGVVGLVRCSPGFTPDDPRPGPRTPTRGYTPGLEPGQVPGTGACTLGLWVPCLYSPHRPGDPAVTSGCRLGAPRPPVYPGPWRGRRFQEGGLSAAATEHRKPRLCGAGGNAPARDPAWSSARALGGAPRPKSSIPPPETSRERWEASASRRDEGQRGPGQALASHADPGPARTTCCVTLDGIKTSEPYLSISL